MICSTCGIPVDEQGRCPQCKMVLVEATFSVPMESLQSVSRRFYLQADDGSPIEWSEVERLLEKQEYAAAVLVTAINVEFTLKQKIIEYARSITKHNKKIKSIISRITESRSSLGSCFKDAQYLAQHHGFTLQGNWVSQIEPLVDIRNKIAHQPGYFANFTRLKIIGKDAVEKLIRDARDFCSLN